MPKNNARPLPPRRRPLQDLSNNVAGPSVAQKNPEEKSGNASEQDVDQVVDPNQIIEEIIDLCDTATGQGVDPDEDEDEEKEDKIDWVTRLRISNQKPPKDLGHFMPNGDIPINETNVKRFNEKCVSIITNLKSFADQQTAHSDVNWSDRAMTKVVIRVFQRLELADLTHAFLDSVPDVVKTILGAPELLPTDLLYLPLVDSSFRLWGVYVDIAMKADTDEVMGVYVGSSVAYKSYIGINGRVRHHERQAQREYSQLPENKRSRHYEAICRDDVEPNFRVLSLFEVTPGNSVGTTIAEQVMVLFLGTMPSANPVQEQFARDIRALTPGLPNFGNLGLNRALPLAQSQRWMPTSQKLYVEWLKETNQLNQCFNCGRPGNETCDDKGWVGWYETRRCQPCYNWRWKYGEEKPRDLITDQQMHDIWVAQGNPDVCGNPACKEPRRPNAGPSAFGFYGPDSRCQGCLSWRRIHNEDPENPKKGNNAASHQAWVAEGNDDVYWTCHTPRPVDSHLLGWMGWVKQSKCPSCLHKPTPQEDAEWVQVYGDICAICGVDRGFTRYIRHRCNQRRCDSCTVFREKNRRDKNEDEVDAGTPALQREWLAAGNADVCQECGKGREGGGKFYGLRENTKCKTCYTRASYRVKHGVPERNFVVRY